MSAKFGVFRSIEDTLRNWSSGLNKEFRRRPEYQDGERFNTGNVLVFNKDKALWEKNPGWQSWTPTYSALSPMTFTTVTTNYAKYFLLGKILFFSIRATGTTGGTASTDLEFTLPFPMFNSLAMGGGVTVNDANTISGFSFGNADKIKVSIRKYDSSNFGLGANRLFIMNSFYEIE